MLKCSAVARSINAFITVSAVTLVLFACHVVALFDDEQDVDCRHLLPGQFFCEQPEINTQTQQPVNCTKENVALVNCHVISNISCVGLFNGTFSMPVGCRYGSRKSFKIALLLSVFFGWIGFDRFYLGYFTLGMFKMWTCGFFFLFHLLDIILIALQIVQPADGHGYFFDYYGPMIHRVAMNNETFIYSPNY